MRQKRPEQLAFLLLSVSLFSLVFPIILEVFNIPHNKWLIVTISVLSIIALFIKKYWIKIPSYLLVIMCSFYLTYNRDGYPSFWVISKIFYSEFSRFMTGKLTDIPLFLPHIFILLFLLVLVELQFKARKTTFVGLVLVSYLLLLDVFNDIDIVKPLVFVIPLILLIKVVVNQGIPNPLSLIAPLIFILTLSLIIWGLPTEKIESYLLGKTVTYRTKMTKLGVYATIDQRKYGGISRSGFGEDDAELGGAIADDRRVQFEVKQKNPHYWRIDSKEIYTGKGWESTDLAKEAPSYFEEEIPIENGLVNSSEDELIEISFINPVNYVPTTYGEMKITSKVNRKRFEQNRVTNRVNLADSNLKNKFEINLFPSNYSEEELKQVALRTPISEVDYLQLPENYSKKVTDLAREITQGSSNLFEQVKKIESYLKNSSELTYSKTDTSYPGTNQDYVEHFLFESQVGYCDNISTAMIVMLRGLDIPARWVKGFNTGVVTGKSEEMDVYSIRNEDAHSWVEVYFEGFGWIPFEPTPTFNQPKVEKNESNTESSTEQMLNTKESVTKTSETKKEAEEKEQPIEKQVSQVKKKIDWDKYVPIILAILLTLLVVAGLMAYRYLLYIQGLFLLRDEKKGFMKLYPKILEKMEMKISRDENMPLAEFATLFEMQFSDYKPYFSELTELYENELYGNIQEFEEKDKEKVLNLILLIIKKN